MRLSGFNVAAVQFAAYRLDLGAAVRTSKAWEKFDKTLASRHLEGASPAASWRFPMGRVYPDHWAERAVTVPPLPPGAYLIRAARTASKNEPGWRSLRPPCSPSGRGRNCWPTRRTPARDGQCPTSSSR